MRWQRGCVCIRNARMTTRAGADEEDMAGFSNGDSWSVDQSAFLQRNYTTLPVSEIAAKLNRSEAAVRTKAFQLELGRCQALTVDEVE